MTLQEYKLIHQNDTTPEIETLFYLNLQRQLRLFKRGFLATGILLLVSLFFNALWTYQTLPWTSKSTTAPTKYSMLPEYSQNWCNLLRRVTAGLVRNISTPFSIDTLYTNANRTISDAAWSSPDLDSEVGLVALTDEYAKSKGLLPAQRWPWDHSKGIYILNGFHNLHCLVGIASIQMPSC